MLLLYHCFENNCKRIFFSCFAAFGSFAFLLFISVLLSIMLPIKLHLFCLYFVGDGILLSFCLIYYQFYYKEFLVVVVLIFRSLRNSSCLQKDHLRIEIERYVKGLRVTKIGKIIKF